MADGPSKPANADGFDPEYHKQLLMKFDKMMEDFSQMRREVRDLDEKVEQHGIKAAEPEKPTVSPEEMQEVKKEFEGLQT